MNPRVNRNTRPGNRRRVTKGQRRQQHLLDVKVRSRKASQQRNRLVTKLFFSVVVVAGLTAGAVIGGKHALSRFLWNNPDYRIAEVDVSTDGTLPREEVMRAAGISEGANIFSIKLSTARERLEHLPQIERAELKRVLPNRLVVKILERRAVAWVASSDATDPTLAPDSMLVDPRGIFFKSDGDLRASLHLPVIHGVSTAGLHSGEVASSPELRAALELIRLGERDTRFQIRTIDVSKGYCIVATDKEHAKITFGLDQLAFQLDRLSQLLDYMDGTAQQIQTVNLMVERNVPVTFAPPVDSAEPETTAEIKPAPAASSAPAPKATPRATPRPIPVREKQPFRPPDAHRPAPTPAQGPEIRRAMPVRRALPATQ